MFCIDLFLTMKKNECLVLMRLSGNENNLIMNHQLDDEHILF